VEESVTARRDATATFERANFVDIIMSKQRLELKVRQVRELQTKHGISNLLAPTPEEAGKLANVDVLVDIYHEGSRSWENPPTMDAIEDLTTADLLEGVKSLWESEGK
jgi:predicted transport protein